MTRTENLQRQRAIVEQLQALMQEMIDLNRESLPHDKTDVIMLVGQHRHAFEEQGVADHTNCVTLHAATGNISGAIGLLISWGLSDGGAPEQMMLAAIGGIMQMKVKHRPHQN